MSQEKPVIKKLPCGGYAIFASDSKSKTLVQVGYLGANLPVEGYLPKDVVVET